MILKDISSLGRFGIYIYSNIRIIYNGGKCFGWLLSQQFLYEHVNNYYKND